MARIGPEEWLATERRDQQVSRSQWKRALAGVYSPAPFVVIPAIASLPIMAIAGEGDFIVPVMGAMWSVLFVVAIYLRRVFEERSVRRACATGTAIWSLLLAVAMFGMTMAFMSDGGWR